MNYKQWLDCAAKKLYYSDSPKRDAEILIQHITGKNRTFIIAFSDTELTVKQQQLLKNLLVRRSNGEPIAYLVKEKEFWSLPIKVSPITLIPRTDTECLVERTLQLLSTQKTTKILDLGTGTGAIALAIASECKKAKIIGIDISDNIIKLAKLNAKNLLINNIKFYKSNWFASLPIQEFDIIVSNPPYIDKYDPYLQKGDVRFEPKIALISDNHGLADIQLIIEQSRHYLANNGWLLLEHGWLQGEQVRKLFFCYHYKQVVTFKDYGGNERITVGQWNRDENNHS
ncbi:Release factor glutamine methyltransferase [Candidatus Arsenophonus lipoptenae]|uniref:Release factor glutamine methyltransferase n=1 Tax=Candidatus Arsenophonus lipoptenae TaxID=634113 RepID=A0A0X9VEN9_9GAMM|nr:peptide chain release factor N(5)-glutamine methyltransferase [Candidatus Arsenophonus lipoptenae]AMA65079.1 Release factor glutamine methyltransferase [Candidatus Arsenophonus lipoptenae]